MGKKGTEEKKKKLSIKFSGINNPFYGKTHTDETKKKISNIRKKYVGKNHPMAKSVICLETGVIYDYIGQAAKELSLQSSHIGQCCKGKQKTTGGYHWAFIDDINKVDYGRRKKS